MSIISAALKKVEGKSAAGPPREVSGPPHPARAAEYQPAYPVAKTSAGPSFLFIVWLTTVVLIVVVAGAVIIMVQRTGPAPAPVVVTVAPAEPAKPEELPEELPEQLPEEPPVADAIPLVAGPDAVVPPPAAVIPESSRVVAVQPVAPAPGPPRGPVPEAPSAAAPPVAVVPPPAGVDPAVAAAGVVASAPPTGPRVRPQTSGLELSGVVFAPGSRLAHINGKILGEGAEIKGYRLVEIARESVLLEKDGKRYILRLKR